MDEDFHSLRSEEDRMIGWETHKIPAPYLSSSAQKRRLTMEECEDYAKSTIDFFDELSLQVRRDVESLLSLYATNDQTCKTIHSKTSSQQSFDASIDEESFLHRGTSSDFIGGTKKSLTASCKEMQVDKPDTQKTSHLLSMSVDADGKSVLENSIYECPKDWSMCGPACSTDGEANRAKTKEVPQGLTGNNSLEIELTTGRTDGEPVSDEQSTPRFGCKKLRGNSSFESQLTPQHPHGTSRELKESNICDLCGKSFTRSCALSRHKREVHDKGTPRFGCKKLRGNSSFKSQLTPQHQHGTSREMREPIICDLCGKSFPRFDALYRHKTENHMVTQFFCDVCGKSFAQKQSLNYHKEWVHYLRCV